MLNIFEILSHLTMDVTGGNSSICGMDMTLHGGFRQFILFSFWKTGSLPGYYYFHLLFYAMGETIAK